MWGAAGLALVLAWSASAHAVTVEELIAQSLASHPSLRVRQANRDAALDEQRVAELRYYPTPSVSMQSGQTRYSGISGHNSSRPVTFSLTQPLYMGGGLDAGRDKAQARLSAAEYSILEARDDLARRVISAYSEWRRAYMKVSAMRGSVEMHERLLEMIVRRVKSGIATDADELLARSRLTQARAELESYRAAELTQLDSLSELTGNRVTSEALALSLAQPVDVAPREEALAQAMQANPTLLRLAREINAAEAAAREARAQGRPQVLLQLARQVGNPPGSGSPDYTSFGVVVQFSPGAGLSAYAAANSAYKLVAAAEQQLESAKRDLRERIHAEYNEIEVALRRKAELDESARLAESVSASYDRQYRVGRKSWLDLMNAVRERAQAVTMIADVEASLVGSSRRLLVYTGNLSLNQAGEQ